MRDPLDTQRAALPAADLIESPRRGRQLVTRGIARNSFEPAYSQLADILRQRIASGEFQAGDRIPTQAELSRTYGLSPMTVRRAIKILLDEQAVSTVRGRGTFVEAASFAAATFDLGAFQDLLGDDRVRARILGVHVRRASRRVADILDIPEGTRVISIRRVLMNDKDPLLFHREWLIYDPRRPVVETELGVAALRDLFEGRGHSGPKRGRLTLEASVVRADEAPHLSVPVGHPCLVLEHLFFDFDDRPLSWGVFIVRADLLRFEATVGFAAAGTANQQANKAHVGDAR
jgi:GntR family transcriptional regulator